MKPLSPEDCEIAQNLLQIKAKVRSGKLSDQEIGLYRSSLARDNDLALIAAGYALSEGIRSVRQESVEVIQKAVREIATSGLVPGRWAQGAIFEGISWSPNSLLISVKEYLPDFANTLRLASGIDPIYLDSFQERLSELPDAF